MTFSKIFWKNRKNFWKMGIFSYFESISRAEEQKNGLNPSMESTPFLFFICRKNRIATVYIRYVVSRCKFAQIVDFEFWPRNLPPVLRAASSLRSLTRAYSSITPQSSKSNSFRFSLGVSHLRVPSRLLSTLIGISFDRRKYAFICVFKSSKLWNRKNR